MQKKLRGIRQAGESELASRSDIDNLVLAIPEGGYVRLRDVAEVTRAAGPVEVIRSCRRSSLHAVRCMLSRQPFPRADPIARIHCDGCLKRIDKSLIGG
jgi:hypothetical protein